MAGVRGNRTHPRRYQLLISVLKTVRHTSTYPPPSYILCHYIIKAKAYQQIVEWICAIFRYYNENFVLAHNSFIIAFYKDSHVY